MRLTQRVTLSPRATSLVLAALAIVAFVSAARSCMTRPRPSASTSASAALGDTAFAVWVHAEQAVKTLLRDPESARFGPISIVRQSGASGALLACGTFNAKNGFGGYAGPQRFVSGGYATGTVIETSAGATTFSRLWDRACRGRTPVLTR